MNLVTLTSNLCCFLFLFILIIIYTFKQKVKNEENRIYKWILISNVILLVIELLFIFFVAYLPNESMLILLMEKVYFVYIFL